MDNSSAEPSKGFFGGTMSYFDLLAEGSDRHKAQRDGDALRLSAVADNDPEALRAFQEIAIEAIGNQGDDYIVQTIHTTRYEDNSLYDLVILAPVTPAEG